MELAHAQQRAVELMAAHGLTGWGFEFDQAVRRFGCCCYGTRTITLSAVLVALNTPQEVEDTILHEIAHALAPAGAGHGPIWKAVAVKIGCDGMRCYGEHVATPEPKHIYQCLDCGYQFKRVKRIKHYSTHYHVKCRRANKPNRGKLSKVK